MKPYSMLSSMVNQILFIVFMLGSLALTSMFASAWMINGVQGNAHIINKAGSLRMQSYQLLSLVPFSASDSQKLNELAANLNDRQLDSVLIDKDFEPLIADIRNYWNNTLQPQLVNAQDMEQARPSVEAFVAKIDRLLSSLDGQTDQRMRLMINAQNIFIVLVVLLLIVTAIELRKNLMTPWKKMMSMAEAIGHGDFSQRYQSKRHDEMSVLGQAINGMSRELSLIYGQLEERVNEKTAELQKNNRILAFLYQSSRRLHTKEPLCYRVLSVLKPLEELTPLYNIQIRLYEDDDVRRFHQWGCDEKQRPEHCVKQDCQTCISPQSTPIEKNSRYRSWRLQDGGGHYGLVIGQYDIAKPLSEEHEQLIETLVEQLTSALKLERKEEHKRRLILMEERSAIARELHDSIAQSLSCLKIQISCLQMKHSQLAPEVVDSLQEMRTELNAAYSQLRELLTTFRLQIAKTGFYPALQSTLEEYGNKLGFNIALNYSLPPQLVSSHQSVHLLQIIREALNNIFKHAQASRVSVTLDSVNGEVRLSVRDNGVGLPDNVDKANHYGLIIMRDRSQSLQGECDIRKHADGGTEVLVRFQPTLY
jgi:two-component system nitrate/nitrite sensor histidine kinase NarX